MKNSKTKVQNLVFQIILLLLLLLLLNRQMITIVRAIMLLLIHLMKPKIMAIHLKKDISITKIMGLKRTL
jgi:hypothetical protein